MPGHVNSAALIRRFKQLCEAGTPRDLIGAELGRTRRQIFRIHEQLRQAHGYGATLPPSRRHLRMLAWPQKEHDVRRLAREGKGSGMVATELDLPKWRVLEFMREEGLIPENRQKYRGAQRQQSYQLPVNLARVRLPLVDEADVQLAARVWREYEGAA